MADPASTSSAAGGDLSNNTSPHDGGGTSLDADDGTHGGRANGMSAVAMMMLRTSVIHNGLSSVCEEPSVSGISANGRRGSFIASVVGTDSRLATDDEPSTMTAGEHQLPIFSRIPTTPSNNGAAGLLAPPTTPRSITRNSISIHSPHNNSTTNTSNNNTNNNNTNSHHNIHGPNPNQPGSFMLIDLAAAAGSNRSLTDDSTAASSSSSSSSALSSSSSSLSSQFTQSSQQ